MNASAIRLAQSALKKLKLYTGRVDGIRGRATEAAIRAALTELGHDAPLVWTRWSPKRQLVVFLQLMCSAGGIDAGLADGHWGPQTAWAVEAMIETERLGAPHLWREAETAQQSAEHRWPRQAELERYFGPHGAANAGPTPPPPLTRVPCPWRLRIAWNKTESRKHFLVHQKVADSLGAVLQEIAEAYTNKEIQHLGIDLFGGDYNARRMRGGRAWSTHSWGIAIDFDPARNQLKWGRDRARLAHPDAEAFWAAWERRGWVSLGRARNFDWMHVQAARL